MNNDIPFPVIQLRGINDDEHKSYQRILRPAEDRDTLIMPLYIEVQPKALKGRTGIRFVLGEATEKSYCDPAMDLFTRLGCGQKNRVESDNAFQDTREWEPSVPFKRQLAEAAQSYNLRNLMSLTDKTSRLRIYQALAVYDSQRIECLTLKWNTPYLRQVSIPVAKTEWECALIATFERLQFTEEALST